MVVLLIGTVSSSIFGFRKSLLKALVERGCDVYMLVTDLDERTKEKADVELGIKVLRYKLSRSGINPFVDLVNAFQLYHIIKYIKPDVVLCYFAKPVIWGGITAKLAGVDNTYGLLEGLGYFFTKTPEKESFRKILIRGIQILLFKCAIPMLKGIAFLNPDDKKELIEACGIRSKNVAVLGGIGVNLKEFYEVDPPADVMRFIFVGRLLREKGINEFLKAARLIKEKYDRVEFIVVGEFDYDNPGTVDKVVLDKSVKDGVIIYPGSVRDVREWLIKSSVFVLPSYREGLPRSTQEAMAIGRAIITTDVPGCRETVVNGINGYIVKPHDFVSLAEAIEKFILNPHLIESMGRKSRELAEKLFDEKIFNEKIMKFMGL